MIEPYLSKERYGQLLGALAREDATPFEDQISTMGILLDYKFIDAVLLKASAIHDLFEDASGMPDVNKDEIVRLDDDGQAVYDRDYSASTTGMRQSSIRESPMPSSTA